MSAPWVLVAGDFTPFGGMDRANYELARHLAEHDTDVHLVAHRVAPPLDGHPRVRWHRAPKPFGKHLLGAPLLARRGRAVAAHTTGARVVVNGGNCAWPGINWVHAVHAAWDTRDRTAPATVRLRSWWAKQTARAHERRALAQARLVVTNSSRARSQLVARVGVPADRVHVVYYGIDAAQFRPFTPDERRAARARLGLPDGAPVLAFVGALGHDRNKGFDLLFAAFRTLAAEPRFDAHLIAAGDGAEVPHWRALAAQAGLGGRVHLLGFTAGVVDVLAAADGLASPTHYEAYGLGVHEALCCGLPAFITRSAGVAERVPPALDELLLDDPPRADDLVRRLRRWHGELDAHKARVAPLGAELRRRSWSDMAAEIVALAEAMPA